MHRAHYDADGNIILEFETREVPLHTLDSKKEEKPEEILHHTRKAAWTVLPDLPEAIPVREPSVIKQMKYPSLLSESLRESRKQYVDVVTSAESGIVESLKELRGIPSRMRGALKTLKEYATTPIHFRVNAKSQKQKNMQLFVTDTVRFGGTFALIFTVLFVGVNYQSFFQIARAQLALNTDIETEQALQKMESTELTVRTRNITDRNSEKNILTYLPDVGPFESRLIIPKLGKNIPIIRPSTDALVKEDWKQFETDIQHALRDGVVHYPGSARAGQAGNFFLTGHSSYYPWDDGKYKDVFARLPELDIGDTYFVYYGGDKHTYRIVKKYEVKPNNVSVLDQPSDRRLSTLMTCTPVGTTLRRLIVQAEEIDPRTNEVLKVGQKTDESAPTSLKRLEALPI